MRITVDVDSQTGQPTVSTQALTGTAGQGGGLNGGAARVGGGVSSSGMAGGTLSIKAQDGGTARGGGKVSDSTALQAKDAGAAPAREKN